MNAFFSANVLSQETLNPRQVKFYLFVSAFVAGNLLFPALVHAVPRGGLIFLPIYFFTLIAAYRFGLPAGLATALLSPLVLNLVIVVAAYQLVGGAYEAVKAGNVQAALGDWVLGWPGLLVQVVAGSLMIGLWPRGGTGAGQAAR